jgi:hypothetical protein
MRKSYLPSLVPVYELAAFAGTCFSSEAMVCQMLQITISRDSGQKLATAVTTECVYEGNSLKSRGSNSVKKRSQC